MAAAPSEAACQDDLDGRVNRSSLDMRCRDASLVDELMLPPIASDAAYVSSSHPLASNKELTGYQKQKLWSYSCSRSGGILRTRRPSNIDFARSPGCSVSTKCPDNSGLSTPALSRLTSVKSASSLPAVQADDDNPELRATRIQCPAADFAAGHGSRCKPGACRCGLIRIEATVDIPEPAFLDETQYPRLLRHAGPNRKTSSLSALGLKTKQPAAQHHDPAEAAQARIQQRIGLRCPHSSIELPPRPAAREERPEVKMRRRLYQESLTARRAELVQQISALRNLLNDSQPQPRASVDRWQKLKGAMELSLQGVHCLLEDLDDSTSRKKIIAIAQPCTPELVEREHGRYPVYAQYRHSVEIMSTPEPT